MKCNKILIFSLTLIAAACGTKGDKEPEINDSTTPLHLLKPDYAVPYGVPEESKVREDVRRVFDYISSVTPAAVTDSTGKKIELNIPLPEGAKLNQGTYRLTSYEWAVMYMALLEASKILDEKEYSAYVSDRIGFMAKSAPAFRELASRTGKYDGQMRQLLAPASLDDAGAMSGAFMLAAMNDSTLRISEFIESYYDIVENGTHHLPDGTIARNRPHHNSVWLDDMFMALPAMAVRSKYTGEPKHLDESLRIATLFVDRMFIPEKNIFRHGYVEGHESQPSMAWGRANGWALLTLSRLLDNTPEDHPLRAQLLDTYRRHVKGLVGLQGKNGFWHQLLDRNDSYPETSATAIFTYCIAHGINEGWLDATVYAPVANLGWAAVASKINDRGEVEGVCVGTGMGFDPAYYYYRPKSVKAAHGYGPVIMAGAEMVRLLSTTYPRINDSAVHYYSVDPEATVPIFSLDENGKATEILH